METAILWEAGALQEGNSRKTGLVAVELRSTHLHSSLMMEDWPGDTATRSIELNTLARFTFSRLCMPG